MVVSVERFWSASISTYLEYGTLLFIHHNLVVITPLLDRLKSLVQFVLTMCTDDQIIRKGETISNLIESSD